MNRVKGAALVTGLAAALLAAAGCGGGTAAPVYMPPTPSPTFPEKGDCQVEPGTLQDPKCTRGDTSPDVVYDGPTFAHTICSPSYPASVKPPAAYLDSVKRWQLLGDESGRPVIAQYLKLSPAQVQLPVYGLYAGGTAASYGVDALVPFELGGTAKPANLWVMPTDALKQKAAAADVARQWVCAAAAPDRPGRAREVESMSIFNWHQLEQVGANQ